MKFAFLIMGFAPERAEIAKAFCDTIAAAGYTPMIYGNTAYYMAKIDFAEICGSYGIWLAQYYDTLGVLLQACENVGSFDREAIRQELATIEYDGLSGHLKFDENRDCPRDYGAVIVENGEWVQLDF